MKRLVPTPLYGRLPGCDRASSGANRVRWNVPASWRVFGCLSHVFPTCRRVSGLSTAVG